MVAKAAWLAVEPDISLESYLASEEIDFFAPKLSWMPDEWTWSEDDHASRCSTGESELL